MKNAILIPLFLMAFSSLTSCVREPELHLHRDNIEIDIPLVQLELDVVWDYRYIYGVYYDWRSEWYYGDDEKLFSGLGFEAIGYHEPSVFELRRYYTGHVPYAPHHMREPFTIEGYSFKHEFKWGFYDLLLWNHLFPSSDDASIATKIDETTTLDSVFASTNTTMRMTRAPNKVVASKAYNQPEELFSAYDRAEEMSPDLKGFVWDEERQTYVKTIEALLQPITYIYLTQVILHNNDGRIVGVDGEADLSGMASSTNVNTGHTGINPISVNYKCSMKRHLAVEGEDVDIVGGRVLTFGMCNMNCNKVSRAPVPEEDDADKHYIDCTFLFSNGAEKTMMFDVTDQVRTRYKGGVLTVHVNVPDIEIPDKPGGSGFDAVVEKEKEETWELEM